MIIFWSIYTANRIAHFGVEHVQFFFLELFSLFSFVSWNSESPDRGLSPPRRQMSPEARSISPRQRSLSPDPGRSGSGEQPRSPSPAPSDAP